MTTASPKSYITETSRPGEGQWLGRRGEGVERARPQPEAIVRPRRRWCPSLVALAWERLFAPSSAGDGSRHRGVRTVRDRRGVDGGGSTASSVAVASKRAITSHDLTSDGETIAGRGLLAGLRGSAFARLPGKGPRLLRWYHLDSLGRRHRGGSAVQHYLVGEPGKCQRRGTDHLGVGGRRWSVGRAWLFEWLRHWLGSSLVAPTIDSALRRWVPSSRGGLTVVCRGKSGDRGAEDVARWVRKGRG